MKKFFENINVFELLSIKYENYQGFKFCILGIEYQNKKTGFQGDLLGIYIADDYFKIFLLYIEFNIKSPFIK